MPSATQPDVSWVEVALTLDDPDLVEPVTEVLARFTPRPVALEYATPQVDARNRVVALGPVTVRAYIPAKRSDWEAVRGRVEEALRRLRPGRRPLPPARFRLLHEHDWAETWKRAYRPIPIGKRLVVVPAWLANPHPERTAIYIEPGMAFGTGLHPSTRLALAEVEVLAPGAPRVVDIGCGSGILSLAALKLGAERAVGVDVDPVAVAVARRNAALNDLAERFTALTGSLDTLRSSEAPFGTGDLVLANILAPVLVDLLRAGLAQVVEPGGALVLSGILDHQADEMAQAARAAGLREARRAIEGEWIALTFRREMKP